ncbi:glycosyltransferase [Pseudokineococcus basanitobsidens]|uniref:Glucosyl-3-phosphoglycerate synthase n=1 Tax=Pseudokineococcus basanitobsidens TaxID=1926649 RepID=A0ABU8RG40_9ACTN
MRLAVVVPAKDEEERIAATVRAARSIDGVDVVVVVDDGSTDRTAVTARAAGARVVRHPRNRGKAAALESGGALVRDLERPPAGVVHDTAGRALATGTPRALLLVDADLGETASATAALAAPVRAGTADASIAVLPRQSAPGGGRGLVVGLARRGILAATGWTPTQPLSGMRCLTRDAFESARPLAPGWGVETAMTVDLLRAGQRVVEVPCALQHRVSGRGWRAQAHRAAQYRDVVRALAARGQLRALLPDRG